MEDFIYLGATVSKTGGTNEDIRRRIDHARVAFNKLHKIWSSNQLNRKTKVKLFFSNVIAVLLYSSETWKITKGDEKLLDTFQHKCLRKILRIYWPMKISNEEVRKTAGVAKISSLIKKRRWQWIGHVIRMDANYHPRIALSWTPEGKRKRGRPKRNTETYHREGEERDWFRIMDRGSRISPGQKQIIEMLLKMASNNKQTNIFAFQNIQIMFYYIWT